MFGTDILAGNKQLQQLRSDNFNAAYPSFEVIFYCLVNGDHHPFREGLKNFIDLTTTYNPNLLLEQPQYLMISIHLWLFS